MFFTFFLLDFLIKHFLPLLFFPHSHTIRAGTLMHSLVASSDGQSFMGVGTCSATSKGQQRKLTTTGHRVH